MMASVYGVLIYAVVFAAVSLVQHLDAAMLIIRTEERRTVLLGSAVNGILLAHIVKIKCLGKGETLLMVIFAGCLLFACLTDVRECYVYQFVWWAAGAAGGILLWFNLQQASVLSLMVYILLQEFFFRRCYGRADCHAFAVCAVVLCALGGGMTAYWMHMLLAFACLGVVQMFAHNVTRKGQLKRAVAFLPYITLGFWVLLFF